MAFRIPWGFGAVVAGAIFLGAGSQSERQIHAAPPPATAASAPATAAPLHLKIVKLNPPASLYVTDEEIGKAIEKGADILMAQFVDSKLKGLDDDPTHEGKGSSPGEDALAVYALEQCGLSIDKPELQKTDPYMKGLIEALKKLRIRESVGTYARGLRSTALSLLDRPEDKKVIESDVIGLLDSCEGGAYTYGLKPDQIGASRMRKYAGAPSYWDNSNSQYGLLGVWSAAEVGAEIPNDYWQAVERHWTETQCADGEWCYGKEDPSNNWGGVPRISMDLAGIASLFVCHDYLDVAQFGMQVGREPFSPPLAKALGWLETGDHSVTTDMGYSGYGVERVGLASGFKYFGSHDWYREMSTQIVHMQRGDGSWNVGSGFGLPIDTSYCLLFLARGRHSILMNKLRFDHFWSNRPRDVARLANFAGHELESVFNWQVVTLQHDWSDWTDAPILYIASHEAPKLTDADFTRIRAFVNSGGLLFTQADGGKTAFTDYVAKILVPRVFPEYGEMTKVPKDSPIYSAFTTMPVKPPLSCITNGARLLLVHSPQDISMWWQQRASKSHKDAFEMGMNLFVYAAGKHEFQNRISTSFIPEPPTDAANGIKVARVKYALPTWDPEPYAWERFAHWMGWETSVKVQTEAVDMEKLGELSPAEVPLAHMTGTLPYDAGDVQVAGLKKYVESGGIVFVDACGGGGFNDNIKKLLARAFPDAKLKRLPPTHPLLTASGPGMSDLSKLDLRPYAKTLSRQADGFSAFSAGKGQVIYSSQDITNGLLGSQTWGINGYTSPYCLNFVKNLVLWAAAGAHAS